MVTQMVLCYVSSYMKLNVTFKVNFKDQIQIHFGEETCLKHNRR